MSNRRHGDVTDEAALAKAEELGGAKMMGPDTVAEGLEIGLFTDPEGNTIGLVKTAGYSKSLPRSKRWQPRHP